MLGGRTPLGDLSNSVKSSLNQASKKQHSSIFSLSEKQSCVSQTALAATKKKSTSIAAGKVHTSSRKALSDISNSGKPNLNEGSKKKYNANLSVVAEELIDANTIAVEKFLHNHQECIKAQAKAMDLDKFLQTLGLDNVTKSWHFSLLVIIVYLLFLTSKLINSHILFLPRLFKTAGKSQVN